MRAQRPSHRCAINRSSAEDRRRGLALFAPALECTNPVDLIRARATLAMAHTRYHVEAHPVALVLSHLRQHAVVVNDGVTGLDRGIGPAVIHDQLSAVCLEL